MPIPLLPHGAAAGVQDLPPEVLHRIVGGAGLHDAAALMLASKELYAAIHTPSIWKSLEFSTLDASAANFVKFASECQELTLRNESPEEIVCFMEKLEALGATTSVLTLRAIVTEPCERMTSQIFEAAAKFPNLETLGVHIQGVENADDIFVDVVMPRLRVFEFAEVDDYDPVYDDDAMGLSFLFGDRCSFPALESVRLVVHTSNVLAAVDRMPLLRSLTYISEDECYPQEEVTKLEGRHLDTLTLCTQYDGISALTRALAEAGGVRHLTIITHADLTIYSPLHAVRELTFLVGAATTLTLDFKSISEETRHDAITVRSATHYGTLRLSACASMQRFVDFWSTNVLRVANTRVIVDPGLV